MKRRVTTGGKASKARRRKALNSKLRNAPVVARHSRSSDAGLREQLDQFKRELNEAREQQSATSEVLRVISSSPGELAPVFQAMLENATRICEATFGILYSYEAEKFRADAMVEVPPTFAEWLVQEPRYWDPSTGLGRLVQTKRAVHIPDVQTEHLYLEGHPQRIAFVKMTGVHTFVAVPMLKEDELIGSICIFRQEVRPFTDKQIELVTNFAAQAVIAIENARLLNELRQRTDDLTESLEQQTATSEVLGVIAASSGELDPVFQAMLRNAMQLCDANFASLFRFENNSPRLMSSLNVPSAVTDFLRSGPYRLTGHNAFRRMIASRQPLHIVDYRDDEAYLTHDPVAVAGVELGGIRTLLLVPMLKNGEIAGAFGIFRQEVRPFTDKQIELVQNFAAQAVIAIENARLLNELRQRTDDLSESLEQQTATSEVLKVISSSPGELEPVFEAMLENATRICEAKFGVLYRFKDGAFHPTSLVNVPAIYAQFIEKRGSFRPAAGNALDRLMRTKTVVHSADEFERKNPHGFGKDRRRTFAGHGADAQRWGTSRSNYDLSPRGPAVRRQANCAAGELRGPGHHRHREHAIAERAT